MKTRIMIMTLLLAFLTTLFVQAENKTFFAGHVYTEDSISGKQTMIPFATLKVYRLDSPNKIIALRISGLDGSYDLKGFDTDSTYIIKVKAPGIEEQSFVTKPNNGRVKSGNLSAHPKLKTASDYKSPVQKQSFSVKELSEDKNISVAQMVEKVPGLLLDDGEITTKDGGSVRLMINGFNPKSDLYNKIKDFPASEVVKGMDYYDLTAFDGLIYDGVLDIRIAIGNEASPPNYKLISLKEYK